MSRLRNRALHLALLLALATVFMLAAFPARASSTKIDRVYSPR
jgi:hypothetical protein